jgi:predicted nucleotidyltransferase
MGNKAVEIDIEKVKAYLQEKENTRLKKQQAELIDAGKILKNLVHIWEKYNIARVYLYGSIIDSKLHRQSDIDIAVEGNINFRQLLHLYSEVDRYFSREIDIRILEELPFKEDIKKRGIVIYEK